MAKIKKFTKPVLKKLRVDVDEALKVVAEQYGIEIKGGNWSYTEDTVTMKMEGRVEGGKSAEMLALEMYSEMEVGKKLAVGDEFNFGSNVGKARVVGYKTRAPKYPFIVDNGTERFKIGVESMKRAVAIG